MCCLFVCSDLIVNMDTLYIYMFQIEDKLSFYLQQKCNVFICNKNVTQVKIHTEIKYLQSVETLLQTLNELGWEI